MGMNVWWFAHHKRQAAQEFAANLAASTHPREQLVFIGSGGYSNTNSPNATPVVNNVWHSLDPTLITTQLNDLCTDLKTEALEGFSLLQPEYALARLQTTTPAQAHTLFYAKITAAFTALEHAVMEGKISCYGISSQMLGLPTSDPLFIDLAQLIACAQDASTAAWGRRKRSAFRFIQTPLNLLELGLLHSQNTHAKTYADPVPVTTLELAARAHIGVFAERVLAAHPHNRPPFTFSEAPQNGEKETWDFMTKQLADRIPPAWQGAPLPALALNAVASLPGVVGAAWDTQISTSKHLIYLQKNGDFGDPAQVVGAA